ncbi:MAG TPA: hypothetical protein VMU90_03510 [Solirubrobacteraceae bacterium]|nr:hypothetical protein [Solirubrobacteraceae bacterium]
MHKPVKWFAGAILAGLSVGAPAASADTNGPTTRDCSLLVPAVGSTFAGVDPDFIQISGVSVASSGTLSTTRDPVTGLQNPVSLTASESPDAGDNTHAVTFMATVSAPGVPSQTLSGSGIGKVVLSLPLTGAATGSSYTISWSATFDNGAHACPGPVTPANLMPSPFTVKAS